MQSSNREPSNSQAPERVRARAVLEFIEGDLSRAPIVFPEAGGEEADARLREEILKRWAGR
jgi:hypothetical protein